MDVLLYLEDTPDVDSDPKYLQYVDDHIEYLIQGSYYRATAITPLQMSKYVGDFSGLIQDIGMERVFIYPALRLNRLHSSADWDGSVDTILLPDPAKFLQLREIYLTST